VRNSQLVKTDCAALRQFPVIMDEIRKPTVTYLVTVSRSSSVSLHSETEVVPDEVLNKSGMYQLSRAVTFQVLLCAGLSAV
jgi:hypothetical protein